MNTTGTRSARGHRLRQRQGGWGLAEMMIAVFIGLLVVGGLFSLLYSLTQASNDQGSMATLQDNERVALMALQNVVETAGYLPQNYFFTTSPTRPSISAALPVVGSYTTVGQFLAGGMEPGRPVMPLASAMCLAWLPVAQTMSPTA